MKINFILTFLAVILISCSGDNIYNVTPDKTNVVVISDNEESSDIIINVMGSIRRVKPNANVSFIHAKAFDLFEATYHLKIASDSYPDSTFFIVVVEPGAGSLRMVCNGKNGRKYLMPDNGVASRLLDKNELSDFYYVMNEEVLSGGDYHQMPIENFYSEAAASLLKNIPLDQFGDKFNNPFTLNIMPPKEDNSVVSGQVLFVNNFGNCHTNIPDYMMSGFQQGDLLKITAGDKTFYAKFGTKYSSVGLDQNVAFVDASNRLKLAVNYGNMGERYGISAGTEITISKDIVSIGLLLYNNSSVVQTIVAGMKQELEEIGLNENSSVRFIERNADSDPSRLPGLIQEILADGVEFFVAVSTPASQAAIHLVPEEVPVIFTYVTDPKSAGILDVRSKVTGLSDATNFKDYLAFVKRILPNLYEAGRIYNPNESNSEFAQNTMLSLIPLYNLNFISATATSVSQIPTAYSSVTSRAIGAVLIAADNALSKGMAELSTLCIADNIPLIGDSYQHCGDGALASISVNYDELATSTGDLLGSIILGADPDKQNVRYFSTNVIAVNTKTAEDIGFTIPTDILNEAKYIYP
jgi:putative tryptophan/tyrosine transport system substrate-binding protein